MSDFELKGYDAKAPVLYLREDDQLEWRISTQNAKIFFPSRQKYIFAGPDCFKRLPPGIHKNLLKDLDAADDVELWEACRKNICFNAPGNPHHEHTPANPPEHHRSTTKTRKNGLRVVAEKAKSAIGTPQMVHIAKWLADQHPNQVLDDAMLEATMIRMQRINRMNTRQDPFLVFRYYRRKMIQLGILEEV